MGIRCADHVTPLYPQKLALTSPTGGGRSVGIVRSQTKATELPQTSWRQHRPWSDSKWRLSTSFHSKPYGSDFQTLSTAKSRKSPVLATHAEIRATHNLSGSLDYFWISLFVRSAVGLSIPAVFEVKCRTSGVRSVTRDEVKQFHYRPGQAQSFSGGWGSQISRQSAHESGQVVNPTHRPPLPPGNILGTHFC